MKFLYSVNFKGCSWEQPKEKMKAELKEDTTPYSDVYSEGKRII